MLLFSCKKKKNLRQTNTCCRPYIILGNIWLISKHHLHQPLKLGKEATKGKYSTVMKLLSSVLETRQRGLKM